MNNHIKKFLYIILLFSLVFIFLTSLSYSNKITNNIFILKYSFDFWFDDNAAVATLHIEKINKDTIKAKLIGETKGVIGFFANYRKDIMISEMRFSDKFQRYIPLKFTKKVIIGKKLRETTYLFDYKDKTIYKKRIKIYYKCIEDDTIDFDSEEQCIEKKITKTSSSEIPITYFPFDDYLTAAINFMFKFYKLKDNEDLTIKIFPEKKNKKKRKKILVQLIDKNDKFIRIKAILKVNFISDKIKKINALLDKNYIPFIVNIPVGGLVGTIKVRKIKETEGF